MKSVICSLLLWSLLAADLGAQALPAKERVIHAGVMALAVDSMRVRNADVLNVKPSDVEESQTDLNLALKQAKTKGEFDLLASVAGYLAATSRNNVGRIDLIDQSWKAWQLAHPGLDGAALERARITNREGVLRGPVVLQMNAREAACKAQLERMAMDGIYSPATACANVQVSIVASK